MPARIQQTESFDATPDRVYAALTEAKRFSAMGGGAPTEIDATAGGAFSLFGGMIFGRTLECIPGQRLVQAWRVKMWPPGAYSVAHFELKADGKRTQLTLDHAGFPESEAEHLAEGWKENYWEPIRKALAG